MNRIITISIAALLLAACQQKDAAEKAGQTAAGSTPRPDSTAQQAPASYQSIGTVASARFADVKFEASQPVVRVMVSDGDRVRQGQLLAELDAYRQHNAVEQCQKEIEQARLQMQEVIISQGYDPAQMQGVPQSVRHIAEVKSGLLLAQSKLAAAQAELRLTRVVAPFDGVVADVAARAGQLAQVGEKVCRVIATQQMDIDFRVMEADLSQFPLGTRLRIVPVADQNAVYEARVTAINPVVDEQGAVRLKARVVTPNKLFDGMHVAVSLVEPTPQEP